MLFLRTRLLSLAIVVLIVGALLEATAGPAAAFPGGPWFRPGVPYTQNFPDPTVVRDDSTTPATYWAYSTSTGGSMLPAMSSTDLATWTPRPAYPFAGGTNGYNADPYFNDSFPVPPRWSKGGTSRTSKAQWGPGVARFGSTWVAFTSWEVSDTRRCISMATASSPAGPFVDPSDAPFVCDTDPAGSIDPEPFIDVDGSAFLVWKASGVVGSTPTRIMSRRLAPDGQHFALFSLPQPILATDGGTIINGIPQEDTWEGHGIENPSMIHAGGTYWLIYSADEWRSGDYRMGQARCAGPQGPCVRTSSTPLLPNTATELGRGGGALFLDAAGQLRMMYHAWNAPFTDYPAYPACTDTNTCTTQGQRYFHLLPLVATGSSLRVGTDPPQPPAAPGGFVPITPVRAIDTRQTGSCLGSDPITVQIAGVNGVPTDAAAVSLNVTVTEPDHEGFLTVWPGGTARPDASNLNFVAGQTVPNMVTVRLGGDGTISVHANQGCPQVIIDVAGHYRPGAGAPGTFVGLRPTRALDTRTAGPCVSGSGRVLGLVGRSGIPVGADSVALNLTVTRPNLAGFLTVWPTGTTRPVASNLNYVAGQTVPNMVVAKLGADGSIAIFASQGCPDVIVDVTGYFIGGAPVVTGGEVGIVPIRALDTRIDGPAICANGRSVVVRGRFGVPARADAVLLNVTATEASLPGFLTVWPSGAPRPIASNLNYVAGQTVPNMVSAAIGADGQILIATNQGCPQVVVDIVGYSMGAQT